MKKRLKQKGRMPSGGFAALPYIVLQSENWAKCSPSAIKLLIDLFGQFKGSNNGDLSGAISVIGKRGWTRSQSVTNAARELIHYGMIELTRKGNLHACNLYAVTWLSIDVCNGKLHVPPTHLASGKWKEAKEPFVRPIKKRQAANRSAVRTQCVPAQPMAHLQ